jgi:hypothetical protein
VKKKLVHRPTHEYIGKKGRPFNEQNRNKPEMKASVRPVGAIKAIGWPHMTAYACKDVSWKMRRGIQQYPDEPTQLTMPLAPALKRNSTTPIESFVICEAIVPKLIAGERQAKYKNRIAGTTFFMFLKPSVQSET